MDSKFFKIVFDLLSRCQFRVAERQGIGGFLVETDS